MATETKTPTETTDAQIENMYEQIYNGSLGDINVYVEGDSWLCIKKLLFAKCPKLEKDVCRFYNAPLPVLNLREYNIDAVRYLIKYLYTGKFYAKHLTPRTSMEIQHLFVKYELPIDPKLDDLIIQFINEDRYTALITANNLKIDMYKNLALKKIRSTICKFYGKFHLFHECERGDCNLILSVKDQQELEKAESVKINELPGELRTLIFSEMYTADERKVKEAERKKEIDKITKVKTEEDGVIVDIPSPEKSSKPNPIHIL
jgi:hypothetical protein